jgi:hypothetical protein
LSQEQLLEGFGRNKEAFEAELSARRQSFGIKLISREQELAKMQQKTEQQTAEWESLRAKLQVFTLHKVIVTY